MTKKTKREANEALHAVAGLVALGERRNARDKKTKTKANARDRQRSCCSCDGDGCFAPDSNADFAAALAQTDRDGDGSVKSFWIVTDPGPLSVLGDICFDADVLKLARVVVGGGAAFQRENPTMFLSREAAEIEAHRRLVARDGIELNCARCGAKKDGGR